MPQDQNPESPEMRTNLAALIAKGHVKTGTVPQDQIPPSFVAALEPLIAKGYVPSDESVPLRYQDQVPSVPPKDEQFPRYQDQVPERRPFRHVPDAGMRNIGDDVREWAYQAIKAVAQGGRISWDVSLGLAPAGNGSFVSAYILVIYMPSILLGQPPLGVVRIIPDDPDQDLIRKAVLSAVGEIKDKQNAMTNPHG